MNPKSLVASLVASLVVNAAHGAVDFAFNFIDAPGVGFNHSTQGAARRAALNQAAGIVESLFTGYTAIIVIEVDGGETTNGVLASAASNYNSATPLPSFSEQGDVMKKILGGNAADPDAGLADGVVSWNFQDFTWELGTSFQANEFDFISTAAHELLHTVGFGSDIAENGSNAYGTPAGQAAVWSPFDRWVAGASGSIINSADFKLNLTRWNSAKTAGAGMGIRFVGPNALAANGGNPVFLHSPNPWEDGSSGSHLDDGVYNGAYMMEAATGPGLGIRTFSALEAAMLKDIGYTLIPEPGSASLLLAALSLLLARRRR